MSEIIKKRGNACNAESDFPFPILKESMNQIEMHFVVKLYQIYKRYNEESWSGIGS
jgi:hypothetical protein